VPTNDIRRLPRRDGDSKTSSSSPPSGSPEFLAYEALARLLRSPERPLLGIIQEAVPGNDVGLQAKILQMARATIENSIEVLHKSTADQAAPVLVDRLSFTWSILRQADVAVRKLKKAGMPTRTDVAFARNVFERLLPGAIAEPFLLQILDSLRLGSDARYLYHYWFFRKTSGAPTTLPAPLGNAGQNGDLELIRRIIWWSLRARREQYVQVASGEPVRIEFEWVVEAILRELPAWCGADVNVLPGLAGEVESELNRWLTYSQVESGGTTEVALEIARAFIKFNDLETKLVVAGPPTAQSADSRVTALQAAIKEHEATIKQYADENRRLEEQLGSLRNRPVAVDPASTATTDGLAAPDLREVLKLIDSKYSFDVLNSVQLGQDSHLTLRSFVAHLFYSLRKKGFGEYPSQEEFDLSYELSGLYDCEGFEVPPGETRRVRVVKKGWALLGKDRTLPIRRATVALSGQSGDART
jgi:hypothetical protein